MNTLKKFGLLVAIGILSIVPQISFAQSVSVDADILPITSGGVRILVNSIKPVTIISSNTTVGNNCTNVNGTLTSTAVAGTTNAAASGATFYARYGTSEAATAIGSSDGINTGTFNIPSNTQLKATCISEGSPSTFSFASPLSYAVNANFQQGSVYHFKVYVTMPGYGTFSTPSKSINIALSQGSQPGPTTVTGSQPGQSTDTQFLKLKNPLGDKITSIPAFIEALINILLTIGVPIVAIMIIWSGFLLVTARGNEKKISEGKKAFLAAVIGGAILLGAYVIAQAIGSTIDQIRN